MAIWRSCRAWSVEHRGSKQSWKLAQIVANLLGAILQRTQTVRISFHLNQARLGDNLKITMREMKGVKVYGYICTVYMYDTYIVIYILISKSPST